MAILCSSSSGNLLLLTVSYLGVFICDEVMLDKKCDSAVSPRAAMYNWTHIAVTCEQDNGFKMFFNGELASSNKSFIDLNLGWHNWDMMRPPEETFGVRRFSVNSGDPPQNRLLIMDLHIFGFALPPDKIYDLNRGKQFVEMNFLFY